MANEYLVGVPSWHWRRFYAVFVHFTHPQHGGCLIDTGYGPAIFEQTRRLPWRLLRWVTPMAAGQPFMQPDYLASQRIDAAKIKHIFVSHFHADHIGGTRLFPESKFVYRAETLTALQRLKSWRKMEQGFIPGLLPEDFVDRGLPLAEIQFSLNPARFPEFRSCDYWGDGSLILLDLPGHALGHTGYLLNTAEGPLLYVADAFWDRRAFDSQRALPLLSRRILHSYADYQATNAGLRRVIRAHQLEPLACHCLVTQEHVPRTAN